MLAVIGSGLLTGWAIAVPIGAVGAFLVALTARTSYAVGAAAALGIATVDGAYAALAVLAGAALADLLEPAATALRIGSGLVLLVVAGLTAVRARRPAEGTGSPRPLAPGRAYVLFLGLTAVNPATVVYFAAVVLGHRELTAGPVEGTVFVLAAFVASASWQLVLAGGGAALGRVATGTRARRTTGLVAAAVVAGLAIHTMLG